MDRTKGIGGSDVAAIMGLSPWKTAVDVYLEKIGTSQPQKESEVLKRGKRLEKYILEEYAERNNVELDTENLNIVHPTISYLIGTIDARVKGQNVLVEAKSCGGHASRWGGEVPVYYRTQMAHYAMITDCDRVDMPVLFDRWYYEQFAYERDLDFEKEIQKACVDFWHNNVLQKNPPIPQNLDDARALYRVSESIDCEATPKIKEIWQQIKKISETKKEIEKEEETLKLQIMLFMQEKDTLKDDDGEVFVTWKTVNSKILDTSSFRSTLPEVYKKFLKQRTVRFFRIKGFNYETEH